MKRAYIIFILILSLGLVFSGCSDKNKDQYNTNEKTQQEKYKPEYQQAYDSLLHFGRLLRGEEDIENSKQESSEILYLCLPPIYDFLTNIENLSYDKLEKPMTDFLMKEGYSSSEAKKIYENSRGLYPLFKSAYAGDNFDIFANSDIADKLRNSDIFANVEFIEDRALTEDELKSVENDLKLIAEGKLKEGFELIGISADDYKPQKGFNVTVKTNNDTRDIIFYYMNGDWRIYIPQIFEEIKNFLAD